MHHRPSGDCLAACCQLCGGCAVSAGCCPCQRRAALHLIACACPFILLVLTLGTSCPCRSLFLLAGTNPARLLLVRVTTSPWFESFVLLLILASSVVLALDRPGLEPQSRLAQAIRVCNVIFAYAFLAEAVLKVRAHSVRVAPALLVWLWQPVLCCGCRQGEGPWRCTVVRLNAIFAFLAEAVLNAGHPQGLRHHKAAASWLQ